MVYLNRELEKRNEGWWRRWRGPWGVQITNLTHYPVKIKVNPAIHTSDMTNGNFNLGVDSVNLGIGFERQLLGSEKGNILYLQPRGNSLNKENVRIEYKNYYISVELKKNKKWYKIIPCKLLSAHYNFYIREDYENILYQLVDN